jgi:hypothetical protein
MLSPDIAYLGMLASKMIITMLVVVGTSLIVERTGPFIGGMIATLPISAGPSYIFLALDHDSAFIASAALTTLTANAATMLFVAVYAHLAQKHSTTRSLGIGWIFWSCLMAGFSFVPWTLETALLANGLAYFISARLCQAFMSVPKAGILKRGKWDIPMRAFGVVALVGIVITLGNLAGPKAAGIAAPFPIVLSSLAAMLHPRLGGQIAAATLANSLPGLAGFAFAITALHVTAIPLGSAWALSLALLVSVGWNVALVLRKHLTTRPSTEGNSR